MSVRTRSPVVAVLGPTNTGKTHLAIERLCGHSSGMIGFPLRLLAREVYDRVVRIKGAASVALITGEEKIVPPQARWLLCTAESMPVDRDVAFVALDEAQLGADRERGHVFTDRLLNARGREETMLLGSEALRPMVKALVPDADIINRPRFSTLSYAGARKLSRLPKRSVIVAFSAEEVYAVAEMIRRFRGGAAVVMGALSPRTRNAQVAMFQAGEVDYLVATDAIGMGLNMDVAYVAFASLNKFDGQRQRRVTIAEMAQIAGRAGRHQRDGSFGALTETGPGAFTVEEIAAIEEHRFPRLTELYWRCGAPATDSIDALIADLALKPDLPVLRAAPEALDLAILKRLSEESWVRDRARGAGVVDRLWAACGVPDFRKVGLDPHGRFVGRLFGYLSDGAGHVPHDWFAAEIARLDSTDGDVETIAGRIASTRSWAYIANRADWLADPRHWAERTRAIEERLSDALHDRLTQRFVDRRTTALLRRIGADPRALPVEVADDGAVMVDDQPIGRLDGFRFIVASDVNAADKRLLLAAADAHLVRERAHRGAALADAADGAIDLAATDDCVVVVWRGWPVAMLAPGRALDRPRIVLDRAIAPLDGALSRRIQQRLDTWLAARIARDTPSLVALAAVAIDPAASPALRTIAAALGDGGGIAARLPLAPAIDTLAAGDRQRLRRAGIVIGALDLYDPRLLKPRAAAFRRMLIAVRGGTAIAAGPGVEATVLPQAAPGATPVNGFRGFGPQAVRIDIVERIARSVHDARAGRAPFAPDPALAISMGLTPATLARVMVALGFRTAPPLEGRARWRWQGRPPPPPPPAPQRDNGFGALAVLARGNG